MVKRVFFAALAVLVVTGLLVSNSLSNQLIRGDRDENQGLIAITFDDGPDEHTARVLQIFEEIAPESKATFFCVGEASIQHPELIRKIHQQGHEIANHDWTDRVSDLCARREPEAFEADLKRTHQTITEITGVPPRLFRPGCGVYGKDLLRILQGLDVKVPYHPQPVLASHVPLDTSSRVFNEFHRKWVANSIDDGAIIVLHLGSKDDQDRGSRTLRLLPELLREMNNRGFRSITVSQMLENSNPTCSQE